MISAKEAEVERQTPNRSGGRRRSIFMVTRYDTAIRPRLHSNGSVPGTPDIDSTPDVSFKNQGDKTLFFDYESTLQKLDNYYRRLKRLILRYMSPTLGLFPRVGGEHTDVVHIRDSIYCAMSVWALYQAYNRLDDDKGRIHELGQSTVKIMRGALFCWMRQADKVEQFKQNQGPHNALHSKFHYKTGDPIVGTESYGHLQIDVVALYLITLVQMISSGLQIIYTTDEANFIQNLVYYIERAYRTPDYGMWERGSRYHNGQCELHASSIGMTKAALEAINGFNVFGTYGTSSSVIYVDIDAYNRNRTIFETMLPRESSSKNTDTALLPTLTFPCFALHDEKLKARATEKIERKLRGQYGFKRFLRDGYLTVLEDPNKGHYDAGETKNFDGIECEWPMFDLFYLIDAVFRGDVKQMEFYKKRVDDVLKQTPEGDVDETADASPPPEDDDDDADPYALPEIQPDAILPMNFYVRRMDVDEARADPKGASRRSSKEWIDGKVHLMGNALYIISSLLIENLLHVNELDPVRRYLPASERPRKSIRYSFFQRLNTSGSASDLIIQVVLVAESSQLQSMLATYGIQTQTPHQIEPIQVWSAWELVKAYDYLGLNKKLGLSGRPPRPIGILGTSKIYRLCGRLVICYPIMYEQTDFYLSHDIDHVIDDLKADLGFLAKFWKLSGRPTFCMVIRENDIRGDHFPQMLNLLASFKRGDCDGVKIKTGRLQNLVSTACIEHLDFLQNMPEIAMSFKSFEEVTSDTGYKSLTDIPRAIRKLSMNYLSTESWENKSTWDICQCLRTCESSQMAARLMHIVLVREGPGFYLDDGTIVDKIERLAKTAANSKNWKVVRFCYSILGKIVDSLVPSTTSVLVRGKQVTFGVFGHEEGVISKPITPADMKSMVYRLCQPHDICQAVLQQELVVSIGKLISTTPEVFDGILKIRIGWVLHAMRLELNYGCEDEEDAKKIEELAPNQVKKLLVKVLSRDLSHRTNLQVRQLNGALNRVPDYFYDRVWEVLERTPGGIRVAGYLLPQQPTLSDMTVYELSFALEVETLLSRVAEPAYGQIIVEMFMVVWTILNRNPELRFQNTLDMDMLVKEAFSYFQSDQSRLHSAESASNMAAFLDTSPDIVNGTTSYLAKAAVNSLLQGPLVEANVNDKPCKMM